MKIGKEELTKILKEEVTKFKNNPDEKYIKLLESSVLSKSNTLKETIQTKINSLKDDKKEKVTILEEILEQLEKINSIL